MNVKNIDNELFIRNVFNFYNGKINILYNAQLQIIWDNFDYMTNGGETTHPNIVRIYPNIIFKNSSNDYELFKFNIIFIIIHELTHTDQFIQYYRMKDPYYCNMIESSCECMATQYVLNHLNFICDKFNLNIDRNYYYNNMMQYLNNYSIGFLQYKRKSYVDHICLVVEDIIPLKTEENIIFINKLVDCFDFPDRDICLKLNDKYINIIQGAKEAYEKEEYFREEIMQLSVFNELIYEYYYKYNCHKVMGINISINDNKYTFEIIFENLTRTIRPKE